jgi:hypothetical protein
VVRQEQSVGRWAFSVGSLALAVALGISLAPYVGGLLALIAVLALAGVLVRVLWQSVVGILTLLLGRPPTFSQVYIWCFATAFSGFFVWMALSNLLAPFPPQYLLDAITLLITLPALGLLAYLPYRVRQRHRRT